MYKDKAKQREANRQAQARFKAKGITNQGIILPEQTDLGNTLTTTQTVGASSPKRGKDIKCFNDLPIDVQDTIVKMSTVDGKVDNDEWNKRTVAAIKYQHLCPEAYSWAGGALKKA